MKRLTVLFFSIIALIAVTTTAQAQSEHTKTEKPATKQPMPKRTSVKYAPGAEPTLSQQIKADEKMLEKLKAIPESKKTAFTKNKIARIERELKEKQKKASQQSSNSDQ